MLDEPFSHKDQGDICKWVSNIASRIFVAVTHRESGRWVRTGDEVKVDENGDVFVVDRLKVTFDSFLRS